METKKSFSTSGLKKTTQKEEKIKKKSSKKEKTNILDSLKRKKQPEEMKSIKPYKRVKIDGYKNISFNASTPAVGHVGRFVSFFCYETKKFKPDFCVIHGFVDDFGKLLNNLKHIEDKENVKEKVEKIKKDEKNKNKDIFYSGVEDYSIIKNNDKVVRFPLFMPSDTKKEEFSKKEDDSSHEHFYFKNELVKIISSTEVPSFSKVEVMNIISKYNSKKKMFFINSTNTQISEINEDINAPHKKFKLLKNVIKRSSDVPFYTNNNFIRYNRIFSVSTTDNLISEIELTKLYKKSNNMSIVNHLNGLVSEAKLFVGKFFIHKDVFLGIKEGSVDKIEGIIEIEFGLFGKGRIEEKFGIYEVNDYVNFLTSNSEFLNYYLILSVIKDKATEPLIKENNFEKSKFPPKSMHEFKFLTRMSCFVEELIWDYKYFVTTFGIKVKFETFSASLSDYLSKRKLVDDCTKNVPRLALPQCDFFILNYFSHELENLKSKESYYDYYIVPCHIKKSIINMYLSLETKKKRDDILSSFDKDKLDIENFINNKKMFSFFNESENESENESDIKSWVLELSSQMDTSVLFFCLRKK